MLLDLTPSSPLPRLLDLPRQPAQMSEELVHLAQFGVLARCNVQKPACELALAVVMHCKMRGYCIAMPDRTGHAKVYDLVLEPRHERAVDIRQDAFLWIGVVESAVPVTTFTATV